MITETRPEKLNPQIRKRAIKENLRSFREYCVRNQFNADRILDPFSIRPSVITEIEYNSDLETGEYVVIKGNTSDGIETADAHRLKDGKCLESQAIMHTLNGFHVRHSVWPVDDHTMHRLSVDDVKSDLSGYLDEWQFQTHYTRFIN